MTATLSRNTFRRSRAGWGAAMALLSFPCALSAQDTPAAPVEVVRLQNGTTLIGRVLSMAGGKVRISVDGADTVTVDSGAVASRSPVPAPPHQSPWSSNFSIGASYASAILPGVAETNIGVELSGSLSRQVPGGVVTLATSLGYQRIRPAAATVDQWGLTLGWRHGLGHRLLYLGQSRLDVNHVWGLRYRSTTLGAVGVRVAMRPKLSLIVAPGVGYVKSAQTDLGRLYSFANGQTPGVDGAAWGVHDMLMVQLAPMLSLEQEILWLRGTDTRHSTQFQFNAKLRGMVTSHLGLLIMFVRSYDSSIPAPVKNTIQTLSSGIQLRP